MKKMENNKVKKTNKFIEINVLVAQVT